MPEFQSTYRMHHCTESALMKVLSDIFNAADCRQVTLLGLLDLSTAFDTADHDVLLMRLDSGDFIRYRWIRAGVAQVVSERQTTGGLFKWCHFSFPLSRVRRSTGVCPPAPVVPALHS